MARGGGARRGRMGRFCRILRRPTASPGPTTRVLFHRRVSSATDSSRRGTKGAGAGGMARGVPVAARAAFAALAALAATAGAPGAAAQGCCPAGQVRRQREGPRPRRGGAGRASPWVLLPPARPPPGPPGRLPPGEAPCLFPRMWRLLHPLRPRSTRLPPADSDAGACVNGSKAFPLWR